MCDKRSYAEEDVDHRNTDLVNALGKELVRQHWDMHAARHAEELMRELEVSDG